MRRGEGGEARILLRTASIVPTEVAEYVWLPWGGAFKAPDPYR